VVVVVGLATTVGPVVVDNPVAGFQLNPVAPLAVSVVLCPLQIEAAEGFIVIVGPGIYVRSLVHVRGHPLLFVMVTV
jgi:hypothetical protein